ncbi:MAG TPA: sugar ABC transporter permease [Clostridiales bacterium]|nr:sugar ABC transporter permease [Clostridiales bacterium]
MLQRIRKDWKRNHTYYFIVLPVILFFLIFNYIPMGGLVMAFQRFKPALGIWRSEWVGFKWFEDFFTGIYFVRTVKNTVIISVIGLIVGAVAPVTLALLLNEVKNRYFKKAVQSITYMPYFISVVVVASLLKILVAPEGPLGQLANSILGVDKNLLSLKEWFKPLLILSDMWSMVGYFCVIYLSALSGIDSELYEAAKIDGAGHWKQMVHVTLPGIAPTIIVLLIIRTGQILNVGYEKILLLYSPGIYETSDVINTFVYRKAFTDGNYGYATAVGLFNSVVGLLLIIGSNYIARKYSETSLF